MEIARRPLQTHSQIVQVANWEPGDDPIVFPVGSKPKKLFICPDETNLPFLIPGHRYIFKTIPGWKQHQLWSEVIAYELAKLCGIDAPPCFAAFNAQTGEAGVLMEFFYGYPDEQQTVRFVHGTDIIQRVDRAYNPELGRPHEVARNIAVCRRYGVPSTTVLDWWGTTLAFDALIGNTDRHAQNWGLLRIEADKVPTWKMAPPFDHGTSLGYEVLEKDLGVSSEQAALQKRIRRGRHHCTWGTSNEKRGEDFFVLCAQVCEAYPRLKGVMERMLPTKDAPLREIVTRCVDFNLPVKFSAERAVFVENLILARRNAIAAGLGL